VILPAPSISTSDKEMFSLSAGDFILGLFVGRELSEATPGSEHVRLTGSRLELVDEVSSEAMQKKPRAFVPSTARGFGLLKPGVEKEDGPAAVCGLAATAGLNFDALSTRDE
jgi:hypothetical protein